MTNFHRITTSAASPSLDFKIRRNGLLHAPKISLRSGLDQILVINSSAGVTADHWIDITGYVDDLGLVTQTINLVSDYLGLGFLHFFRYLPPSSA